MENLKVIESAEVLWPHLHDLVFRAIDIIKSHINVSPNRKFQFNDDEICQLSNVIVVEMYFDEIKSDYFIIYQRNEEIWKQTVNGSWPDKLIELSDYLTERYNKEISPN